MVKSLLAIFLSIFLTTCNPKAIRNDHYHLHIITPLESEIDGNEINIKIDKCIDLLGNWRMTLDGKEVINQASTKTKWPFEYKWILNNSGEHILGVYIMDGNGIEQKQFVRIFN